MHLLKNIAKTQNKNCLDRYISTRNHNLHILKKKNTICIYATIYAYGNSANQKLAKQIAHNIEWHWNFPKAFKIINDKKYKVRFKTKGIYFPSLPANVIRTNIDQKNIFIRVEEQIVTNISVMDGVCSNTGFFKKDNIGYKGASTEAHEYGHALGLWPGTADGHPQDIDQRGQGVPGIMYPRGSLVDPQFQYDPSKPAGQPGGTVMPDKRRVRQLDVDMLFVDKEYILQKPSCRLGRLSSKYHGEQFV